MTEHTISKDTPPRALFINLMKRLPTFWKKIYILLPLILVYIVTVVTEPYFYKLFVDTIEIYLKNTATWANTLSRLFILSGSWVLLALFSLVCFSLYDFLINTYANVDWKNNMMRIARHFFQLPIEYHLKTNLGERQKLYERWSDSLWNVAYEFFVQLFPQILAFVALIGLGIFVNPILALVSLSIVPIWAIVSITVGNIAHKRQKYATELWDAVFGRFLDALGNISVIRIHANEKKEEVILFKKAEIASDTQFWIRKLWCFLNAGGKMLELFGKIIVMIVGTFFVLHWNATLGDLFLFVALAGRIYWPLQWIEYSYRNIIRYLWEYAKTEAILSSPIEKNTGTILLDTFKEHIIFNKLTFIYPETDREVLKDISLTIKKGERVAFVGHTGSGKTTLVNLLTRFYLPTSGNIVIDGVDISDFTLESYRQKFAAVFQDTTLFNDTILHNLEYVRDNVSFEQVREACKQANILDFIEKLEKGFETEVGERWLKLSGWEKQRIAIARAIIADPEVLILDEATSALDSKTERLIQDAFNHLMKGRTSIIIAHRLSTIQHADRIFLFEKGKCIDSGTHAELYTSSPVYKEMVDYQKNGFVA